MADEPKRTNLGKIVPTPISEKRDKHAILDIVAGDGRAYISRKNDNAAPVTDTASWLKITENTYDIAVRLSLYNGSETDFVKAVTDAKLAASNAVSSSAAATAAARTANDSATAADIVRTQALAAVEILRQMIEEGRAEVLNMQAIQEIVVADLQLAPSRMEVDAPVTITVTNRVAQKIDARIFPAYLVQNVLYQQPVNGGASVAVNPDGTLDVLGVGKSRIHVIAANNTGLYQTIEIEVKEPDIRLTGSGAIRLNSDGTIRLT